MPNPCVSVFALIVLFREICNISLNNIQRIEYTNIVRTTELFIVTLKKKTTLAHHDILTEHNFDFLNVCILDRVMHYINKNISE